MKDDYNTQEELRVIATLQRELNIATAALLLTGQLTVVGVFIAPRAYSLSLGGPLFGSTRLEGKNGNKLATALIDGLDIIIAILLLSDAIRAANIVIGPSGFAISVTGPIFGGLLYEPSLPTLQKNYRFFNKIVSNDYDFD